MTFLSDRPVTTLRNTTANRPTVQAETRYISGNHRAPARARNNASATARPTTQAPAVLNA